MGQAEFDVKRIQEIADALSRDHRPVFDRPLGGDDGCLSARHLVSGLQGGISSEQVDHLSRCPMCRENLARLGSISFESGRAFVMKALRKVGEEGRRRTFVDVVTDFLGHSSDIGDLFRRPKPAPALLALEKILPVSDPFTADLTFTCDIIPAFEPNLLRKIRPESLRLAGAIVAKVIDVGNVVDLNKDGRPDFIHVTITGGKLAARVREALERGQHVVDTVRLTGKFEGGEVPGFLGQAQLEFRSKSKL
jgi:hypothetical protein